MPCPILGCMGLASALASMVPLAGQRPNFSGVWNPVVDADAVRPSVASRGDVTFRQGGPGSGWGDGLPLTITQDSARLAVEYQVFSAYDLQPPLHFVYTLGDRTSINTMMIGHTTALLRSSVTWTADTLVITTVYPGPPGQDGRPLDVPVRQALHLESPATLVIETTRAGILGAQETRSRTVYHKP